MEIPSLIYLSEKIYFRQGHRQCLTNAYNGGNPDSE